MIFINIMGRNKKLKEDKKGKITISISSDNYESLTTVKINKSQLVNWLLEQHFNTLYNDRIN